MLYQTDSGGLVVLPSPFRGLGKQRYTRTQQSVHEARSELEIKDGISKAKMVHRRCTCQVKSTK